MNILKSGYERCLQYWSHEIISGPAQAKYVRSVTSGNENQIINAINTGCNLFDYIKNPSEDVICAFIRSEFYSFHKIEHIKLTYKMKIAMICMKPSLYKEYNPNDDHFSDRGKLYLIKENPDVIEYIKNPNDRMIEDAIRLKQNVILKVKQTIERIELALSIEIDCRKGRFSLDYRYHNWINDIDYSDYYNNIGNDKYETLWKKIINHLFVLGEITNKHVKYLNNDQLFDFVKKNNNGLKVALEGCPERITGTLFIASFVFIYNITYIPQIYHDDSMIDKILSNKIYIKEYSKYLAQTDKVINKIRELLSIDSIPLEYQTKDICLRDLKINGSYIKFVREDLVDDEMLEIVYNSNCDIFSLPIKYINRKFCHKLIVNCPSDLDFVPNDLIDDEIFKIIFKSKIIEPRKTRLDFILEYNENKLVTILKYRAYLFQKLDKRKKTKKIIISMLSHNGYNLQYLIKEEQEEEYVKLALSNQPKASKYIL